MSLADVLTNPQNERQQTDWYFAHRQHHELVRDQIQKQFKVNLPLYLMDPVLPTSRKKWLDDHQQMHDDANSILGIPSSDLTTVDFENPLQKDAWTWYNYIEHRNWASKLLI